jgi:hypothetical protein
LLSCTSFATIYFGLSNVFKIFIHVLTRASHQQLVSGSSFLALGTQLDRVATFDRQITSLLFLPGSFALRSLPHVNARSAHPNAFRRISSHIVGLSSLALQGCSQVTLTFQAHSANNGLCWVVSAYRLRTDDLCYAPSIAPAYF